MDFRNRSHQQPAPQPAPTPAPAAPVATPAAAATKRFKRPRNVKWVAIGSTVMLFSVAILILALAMSFVFTPGRNEDKFVDSKKLQAVFLNGGQVYFGNITNLNHRYMRMVNIYYLRVNQQVQPGQQASSNDVSLVKLGCELHGPVDEMVVNREHITFWENLKTDSQVAKAVDEFKKQNPSGQKCETNNQTSNTSNTNDTTSPTPAPTPTPTPSPTPSSNSTTNSR